MVVVFDLFTLHNLSLLLHVRSRPSSVPMFVCLVDIIGT